MPQLSNQKQTKYWSQSLIHNNDFYGVYTPSIILDQQVLFWVSVPFWVYRNNICCFHIGDSTEETVTYFNMQLPLYSYESDILTY